MTTKEHVARTLSMPAIRVCLTSTMRKSFNTRLHRELRTYMANGLDAFNDTHTSYILTSPVTASFEQQVFGSSEVFPWCAFELNQINCTERMQIVGTDKQVCYVFNTKEVNRQLGTMTLQGKGGAYGLTIVVDIHNNDSFFQSYQPRNYGTGVSVTLIDPDGWSDDEGVFLSAGMEHNLAFTYAKHTRLSRPYTDDVCVSRDDDPAYDAEACYLACRMDIAYANCDCAETTASIWSCTYLEVIHCINNNYTLNYLTKKCSHCHANCEKRVYDVDVTSVIFPTSSTYEAIKAYTGLNHTYDQMRENVMVLNVYAKSMTYKVTNQHPAFAVTSLLANVGGLIGLCLGASLITICEFLELLATYGTKRCICFKTKTKVESAVTDAKLKDGE